MKEKFDIADVIKYRERTKNEMRFFKNIIIIISICSIVVGIYLIYNRVSIMKKCSVETIGEVVDITNKLFNTSKRRHYYKLYPVISYQAGDRTIIKENRDSSSKYERKDKVYVLYNPNNVEEYIIKGDNRKIIIGIFYITAGVIVCILVTRFHNKKRESDKMIDEVTDALIEMNKELDKKNTKDILK